MSSSANSKLIDSGFHEPEPERLAVLPKSGTKTDHLTTEKLTLQAATAFSCILYRLWMKKDESKDSSGATTLLEHNFLPLPPGFIPSAVYHQKVKSPYYTKEWFPTLVQLVENLLGKAKVSLPVVMVALLYIGRLRNVVITPFISPVEHLYQLLISALIISQKINSDVKYSMKDWASISGYTLEQVIDLERYFLFYYVRLHCRFGISEIQYGSWQHICRSLQLEYEFIFKSYSLTDRDFEHYLARARRHRPELVEDVIAHRELTRNY